jgi:hypothetical protein
MNKLDFIKGWINARLNERTTWDGYVLIGIGVGIMLAKPILPFLAWGSIGFGLYTALMPEGKTN